MVITLGRKKSSTREKRDTTDTEPKKKKTRREQEKKQTNGPRIKTHNEAKTNEGEKEKAEDPS